MNLSIAMKSIRPKQRNDGSTPIISKELHIINIDTGEELESKTGFLWGGKDLLLSGDEPLLTPEHFEGDPEDASYGILIFRCDTAINI